jgi:hypothetical protein
MSLCYHVIQVNADTVSVIAIYLKGDGKNSKHTAVDKADAIAGWKLIPWRPNLPITFSLSFLFHS